MTAEIVTQEGVEVAYTPANQLQATQEGVEVAYEDSGVSPPTSLQPFQVIWID